MTMACPLQNMISAEFPLLPLELGDITSDESAYIALEDDPLRFKGAVKAGSLNALIDAINVGRKCSLKNYILNQHLSFAGNNSKL